MPLRDNLSRYNDHPLHEWARVGVPEAQVGDWGLCDFILDLPHQPDDALANIDPQEVWYWERQGYEPRYSVPLILQGRTLEEVIAEDRRHAEQHGRLPRVPVLLTNPHADESPRLEEAKTKVQRVRRQSVWEHIRKAD